MHSAIDVAYVKIPGELLKQQTAGRRQQAAKPVVTCIHRSTLTFGAAVTFRAFHGGVGCSRKQAVNIAPEDTSNDGLRVDGPGPHPGREALALELQRPGPATCAPQQALQPHEISQKRSCRSPQAAADCW